MAWNEPGNNNNDPWGGNRRNDGPPDLDEVIKNLQKKFGFLFGSKSGGNGSNSGGGLNGAILGVIAAVLLIVYGIVGFYQVNEQERAVVLHLGVYSETKGPGLHWNPPLIDRVYIENVTALRQWSTSEQMLTKDLNIVNITMSVQYTIADAQSFLLLVRKPEQSLQQATNSALRHVVGSTAMHDVLTQGREQVAVEVQNRLQAYLDNYKTGIRIEKVNVEDSDPPREVQSAFDDVSKAREDEERLKNEAQAYANGIIPEARGKAQRLIEEANAYKEQVIAQAEGEAKRFEYLLAEYQKAPEVTRSRLYIDAVEDVMANSSKVMVDVEGGNNLLYLPLDKIVNAQSSASSLISGGRDLTSSDIDELANQVIEKLRRDQARSSNSRGGR